jgi:hypothetical protein
MVYSDDAVLRNKIENIGTTMVKIDNYCVWSCCGCLPIVGYLGKNLQYVSKLKKLGKETGDKNLISASTFYLITTILFHLCLLLSIYSAIIWFFEDQITTPYFISILLLSLWLPAVFWIKATFQFGRWTNRLTKEFRHISDFKEFKKFIRSMKLYSLTMLFLPIISHVLYASRMGGAGNRLKRIFINSENYKGLKIDPAYNPNQQIASSQTTKSAGSSTSKVYLNQTTIQQTANDDDDDQQTVKPTASPSITNKPADNGTDVEIDESFCAFCGEEIKDETLKVCETCGHRIQKR